MIATLPIFPLTNIILFPGTYLPLHIFETRYRLMLSYCIENEMEMGITSYRNESDIEPIFGWGKIIRKDFLNDGRSNILLQGMGIAELLDYQSTDPFIISTVDKKEYDFENTTTEDYKTLFREILQLTKQYLVKKNSNPSYLEEVDKLNNHPYPLDIISSALEIDYDQKQELLETFNTFDKAILLFSILRRLIVK
jgi:ATP-dependent Lon protease